MIAADAILEEFKTVMAFAGTPIEVAWLEASGGTWNPVRQIFEGETVTPHTLTVNGQFYAANYGDIRLRRLAEERVEHVLFDFPGDALGGLLAPQAGSGETLPDVPVVTTANKRVTGVQFRVNGRTYVPSETARDLTDSFDLMMGGVLVTKTVICKRAL